jgi:hypothetical protein
VIPPYCSQNDGECRTCSLVSYGRDCRNHPSIDYIALYIVTGDAGDLDGWTPETLADALRAPLAELGIDVKCNPQQFGDGGLRILVGMPFLEADTIRDQVKRLVDRVVQDGVEE